MKVKRFDTLDEAAKNTAKKDLAKTALDFIKGELTKTKLSRANIIDKVEAKFKGEKDVDKIAREVADDVTHDPMMSKEKIKSESFKQSHADKKEGKYSIPFYFIGTEAKDPSGIEKVEVKKEEKKEKVKKFDTFKSKEEKEKEEPKKEEKKETKKEEKEEKKEPKKEKKMPSKAEEAVAAKNNESVRVKGFDSFKK